MGSILSLYWIRLPIIHYRLRIGRVKEGRPRPLFFSLARGPRGRLFSLTLDGIFSARSSRLKCRYSMELRKNLCRVYSAINLYVQRFNEFKYIAKTLIIRSAGRMWRRLSTACMITSRNRPLLPNFKSFQKYPSLLNLDRTINKCQLWVKSVYNIKILSLLFCVIYFSVAWNRIVESAQLKAGNFEAGYCKR